MVRAILDDTGFAGEWRATLAAAASNVRRMRALGLVINVSKSVLVWPHEEPPPPEVLAAIETDFDGVLRGTKVAHNSYKLLGSSIGWHLPSRRARGEEKILKTARVLAFIRHPAMPRQVGYLLVKYAVSRLTYMMRTSLTEEIAQALKLFDEEVRATIRTLANARARGPPNSLETTLISLPVTIGGLGVPSCLDTVAQARLAASLASLPTLARLNGHVPMPGEMRAPDTPTMRSLELNLATLTEQLSQETLQSLDLPSSLDRLYCIYGAQPSASLAPLPVGVTAAVARNAAVTRAREQPRLLLQKTLSAALNRVRLETLLSGADTPAHVKALLRTAKTVPGSTTWLTQAPTRAEYMANNRAFSTSLRYVLGIANYADTCPLCRHETMLVGAHAHYLDCQMMRGTALTTRHNAEVRRSTTLWIEAGATVHIEPRYRHDDMHVTNHGGDLRFATSDIPDALITPVTGEPFEIDATFLNTAAPSHASGNPVKLLEAREKKKVERYARHCEVTGTTLVPLVYTTMGGHGKRAKDYASHLAQALVDTVTWNEASATQARAFIMARTAFQAVNSLGAIHAEWTRRAHASTSARNGSGQRGTRGVFSTGGRDSSGGGGGAGGGGGRGGGSFRGGGGRGGSGRGGCGGRGGGSGCSGGAGLGGIGGHSGRVGGGGDHTRAGSPSVLSGVSAASAGGHQEAPAASAATRDGAPQRSERPRPPSRSAVGALGGRNGRSSGRNGRAGRAGDRGTANRTAAGVTDGVRAGDASTVVGEHVRGDNQYGEAGNCRETGDRGGTTSVDDCHSGAAAAPAAAAAAEVEAIAMATAMLSTVQRWLV
jgi:hypothetical protein